MFRRYELHNHTDQSDAKITCRQLIDHMEADSADCFPITDHNTTSGQPIIRKILAEENEDTQKGYIALLALTMRVLENGIDLLGFSAPEKM